MSQDPSVLKQALEPLLKMVLEDEKKSFHSELESWEAHEVKIRAEFETMALCYRDRLMHACDLIRQHFPLKGTP